MELIPTNLPMRPTGIIIRDRVLNESKQKRQHAEQMAEFRRLVRKQGWFCLSGCGRRISANVTLCKACAEKTNSEQTLECGR